MRVFLPSLARKREVINKQVGHERGRQSACLTIPIWRRERLMHVVPVQARESGNVVYDYVTSVRETSHGCPRKLRAQFL